jgi:hypothetical protein
MISFNDVLETHEKLIIASGNFSYEMILEWLSLHVV